MNATPRDRAHLTPGDAIRAGYLGLRSRRMRTLMSALGICIGIASMVSVLGISASSKATLIAQIDSLANLLTVSPGQDVITGRPAVLPAYATITIGRTPDVQAVTGITQLAGIHVYRTDKIPAIDTNGLAVDVADARLLSIVGAQIDRGSWFTRATARYPTVVLGAETAQILGIGHLTPATQVYLGNQWFTVIGVLRPVVAVGDLDSAALVSPGPAQALLGYDGHPTTIYLRVKPQSIDAIRSIVPLSADPPRPEDVQVSRPSDALAARAAAESTYTSLFVGLGAVALLVGGVGIANVMVISVLERRGEIGLRRAVGATRRHVAAQFLTEATLLAGLGGVSGVGLGAAISIGYAHAQRWPTDIPLPVLAGGAALAVVIGAAAGLYPATRAARLPPTDALRMT